MQMVVIKLKIKLSNNNNNNNKQLIEAVKLNRMRHISQTIVEDKKKISINKQMELDTLNGQSEMDSCAI